MQNTLHKQTKAPRYEAGGSFSLPMLQVSPYYSIGRGAIFITIMKAIAGLDYGVSGTGIVGVGFYTGSTLTDAQNLSFNMAGSTDAASLIAAAETAINAYAVAQSYSLSEGIYWPFPSAVPAGLANAPQPAIANAPADATTNYNVVTTLLGTLTSAVNTANTKQNDIATKLNSLLSELRTLGLISS